MTMTEIEIESLDYKLSRLKPGKSTCIKPGEWAYLATDGSLHKITNNGYYFAWKRDMWISSFWFWEEQNQHAIKPFAGAMGPINYGKIKPYGWASGPIGYGKRHLITVIEDKIKDTQKKGLKVGFPAWTRGFGKTHEATQEQEQNA